MTRSPLRPLPITLLVAALSLFGDRHSSAAETADLDAIRSEAVSALSSARSQLIDALNTLVKTTLRKGNPKTAEEIRRQLMTFEADGTLPPGAPREVELYLKKCRAVHFKAIVALKTRLRDATKTNDATSIARAGGLLEQQTAELTTLLSQFELLANPGCEETTPRGLPVGWTAIRGAWDRRTSNPPPFAGAAYFWPAQSPVGELAQEIDVSPYGDLIDDGKLSIRFSGRIRGYPQSPIDTARIVIGFVDRSRKKPLGTYDSGDIEGPNSWREVTETRVVPAETRYVRIALLATRRSGNDNDCYFDDLSLRFVPPK